MHSRNRHQHVHGNSERGYSSKESKDEPDPTEELRRNCQECERRRNVHGAGEVAHGTGEAVASEPAQHFLRPVCEKDNSSHQSQNRRRAVIVCINQFAKHPCISFGIGCLARP